MRNSMKMTKNEYQDYLSSFGMSANLFREYLNDVYFLHGVRMPFNLFEGYVSLEFLN